MSLHLVFALDKISRKAFIGARSSCGGSLRIEQNHGKALAEPDRFESSPVNPETASTMRLTVTHTLAVEGEQSMGARSRSFTRRLVIRAIVLLVAVATAPHLGVAATADDAQAGTRNQIGHVVLHLPAPEGRKCRAPR